jgi:hypothetical protein
MSYITDVLLLFPSYGVDDDNGVALDNINSWIKENSTGILKNLNMHAGGSKSMQACVYGGAFNYLKVDKFIQVVKNQSWENREHVQLLLKNEEEDHFTMHTLLNRLEDS